MVSEPGVAWIEVMVDTEDSSLVLSEAYPLMLTPLTDVAEEANNFIQAADPCHQQEFVAIMEVRAH